MLVAALGAYVYAALMQYGPGERLDLDLSSTSQAASGEPGLLLGRGDYYLQRCCPHSVADTPEGTAFAVRVDDPKVKGNLRSEARLLSNRLNRRAVYEFELTAPTPWRPSAQRVIVAQWHGTDDEFLLEPGRYPPLEIAIENDRWIVVKSWDRRWRSADAGGGNTEGRAEIGSAPFVAGENARWRIEVLWSAGSDGYVRALRNGELVAQDEGANAHRDFVGPYMKFGVYVPEWKKYPDLAIGERRVVFRSVSMAQL